MLKALPLLFICSLASAATARDALDWSVTVEGDGVYGAGVLIDPPHGLVMTCLHVVSEMKQPRVSFADGAAFAATVIDRDRGLDVALLRVPPQRRAAPSLSDPN